MIMPFLFFQIAMGFGQVSNTSKKVENMDTLAKHGALFVMDGVVLQKPYYLNPDSIVDLTIITRNKANEIFHSSAQNDIVVMISSRRAIADYQKKFSAFSEDYRKYLQTHKNDDKNILYILNGVTLDSKNKIELTRELYKIPLKALKKVGYSNNFVEGMKYGATIFITTENQH